MKSWPPRNTCPKSLESMRQPGRHGEAEPKNAPEIDRRRQPEPPASVPFRARGKLVVRYLPCD